jgi:deazaflavin-dependent oxidoreductase (nitroreductase family)
MTMPDDVQEYNRKLIETFRADSGASIGDRSLLLLTTTGARTGTERTTPMMYVRDGDRLLVVASNAGAPRNPDWFHNLVASPAITVEMPGETFRATAVVLLGDDRDATFRRIVARYPFFGDHEAKVTRTIPVVELRRAA